LTTGQCAAGGSRGIRIIATRLVVQ